MGNETSFHPRGTLRDRHAAAQRNAKRAPAQNTRSCGDIHGGSHNEYSHAESPFVSGQQPFEAGRWDGLMQYSPASEPPRTFRSPRENDTVIMTGAKHFQARSRESPMMGTPGIGGSWSDYGTQQSRQSNDITHFFEGRNRDRATLGTPKESRTDVFNGSDGLSLLEERDRSRPTRGTPKAALMEAANQYGGQVAQHQRLEQNGFFTHRGHFPDGYQPTSMMYEQPAFLQQELRNPFEARAYHAAPSYDSRQKSHFPDQFGSMHRSASVPASMQPFTSSAPAAAPLPLPLLIPPLPPMPTLPTLQGPQTCLPLSSGCLTPSVSEMPYPQSRAEPMIAPAGPPTPLQPSLGMFGIPNVNSLQAIPVAENGVSNGSLCAAQLRPGAMFAPTPQCIAPLVGTHYAEKAPEVVPAKAPEVAPAEPMERPIHVPQPNPPWMPSHHQRQQSGDATDADAGAFGIVCGPSSSEPIRHRSSISSMSSTMSVGDPASITHRMSELLNKCRSRLAVSRHSAQDAEEKLQVAEDDLYRIGHDWRDLENEMEVARRLFDSTGESPRSCAPTPEPEENLDRARRAWDILAGTFEKASLTAPIRPHSKLIDVRASEALLSEALLQEAMQRSRRHGRSLRHRPRQDHRRSPRKGAREDVPRSTVDAYPESEGMMQGADGAKANMPALSLPNLDNSQEPQTRMVGPSETVRHSGKRHKKELRSGVNYYVQEAREEADGLRNTDLILD